ncbi:uncharacterized protein KQ657_001650 [Scheffersomyces spartinae]|uniref:Copper acquisition factor BIM1-like domain-containing protein n=1 Tax=Scheffersomyces spartinae TaxID=45513 RepID=A0A9P8AH82_9ASCO|nr:uncharacterized protein KQ657_001650 [Scheffersomyces spartinae]KAG7192551.1 hypothetical protein KQ657_001650 [Scheffersomyces spartinae]
MLIKTSFFTALLASSVSAHFVVEYPGDRGSNEKTQTIGPCGGMNSTVLPRYLWNPKGSPVGVHQHHNLTIFQFNYCPGESCTTQKDFTETVFGTFEQEFTGSLCLPNVVIPGDVGSNGTLQIVFQKDNKYMYNCIDLTISDKANQWNGSDCSNSTGINISPYYINSKFIFDASNITLFDAEEEAATKTQSGQIVTSYQSEMVMDGQTMEMWHTTTLLANETSAFNTAQPSSASTAAGSKTSALIGISSYLTTMVMDGTKTTMYMPTTVAIGSSSSKASFTSAASNSSSSSKGMGVTLNASGISAAVFAVIAGILC